MGLNMGPSDSEMVCWEAECQHYHPTEGPGISCRLQATEADNASKDLAKMTCHCLHTTTPCPVITGWSGGENGHREELGQDLQRLPCTSDANMHHVPWS